MLTQPASSTSVGPSSPGIDQNDIFGNVGQPYGVQHPGQQGNQPQVYQQPSMGNPAQPNGNLQMGQYGSQNTTYPYEPFNMLGEEGGLQDVSGVSPYYSKWERSLDQMGGPMFIDPREHQMDPRYLQEMRNIAFADPGTSPWLKYQMDQDKLRQQSDMDTLQNQGASSLATQQGNLAMRGGLTAGASERMGQQNIMGQLMGNQHLSRSAAAREAGYRQQAEERQRAVLGQLPSAEQQFSTYHSDLDKYATDQRNQAWAAKMMADLIGQGGGGGGDSTLENGIGAVGKAGDPSSSSSIGRIQGIGDAMEDWNWDDAKNQDWWNTYNWRASTPNSPSMPSAPSTPSAPSYTPPDLSKYY